MIGVKAASVRIGEGWRGYYKIPHTDICDGEVKFFGVRKSQYDAEHDAIVALKEWSTKRGIIVIVDYHIL